MCWKMTPTRYCPEMPVCVSFSVQIWCPRESLAQMLSFAILHRGSLSVLIHPLATNEVDDHSLHQMWLGHPFPLDLAALNSTAAGDDPQYPELKLGYSASGL